MPKYNPRIIEFLEFVNKLPLTDEQKITFVEQQIAIGKENEESKKKNKELFKVVLKDLVEL
jgi:hypothetical protein